MRNRRDDVADWTAPELAARLQAIRCELKIALDPLGHWHARVMLNRLAVWERSAGSLGVLILDIADGLRSGRIADRLPEGALAE